MPKPFIISILNLGRKRTEINKYTLYKTFSLFSYGFYWIRLQKNIWTRLDNLKILDALNAGIPCNCKSVSNTINQSLRTKFRSNFSYLSLAFLKECHWCGKSLFFTRFVIVVLHFGDAQRV